MTQFAAPRKSLGQNFLQDPNIINKIVAGLAIKNTDTVVEIGPGRGALTELIIPQAGHTHLIEFDRDLIEYWQQRAESIDNLTVHGSVMLQQRYQIENLFKVPPTAFFPPPKVDSAIARLTPLQKVAHPVANQDDFEKVVKQAFSMRRKTLRNTLKGLLDSEQIEALDINPSARAETLNVASFAALSNFYSSIKLS